ncbi:hypothetical protein HK105_206123 [Polyrhizophydium stewartii]|uniref:Integral membrane protein n=1 Tax=Polyrhizophydium stewartii TaxID=2732419 RepID=A0ABR4N486_9FUNG
MASALATEPVLWYQQDMLLFTLLWTVVVFFVVFTAVGLVAFAMFHRHRAGVFLLVGFSAWGVITGAASGAIVGALLSSFYLTGPLSMPTWVPLAWAIMQVFVAIIFSYSELAFSAL